MRFKLIFFIIFISLNSFAIVNGQDAELVASAATVRITSSLPDFQPCTAVIIHPHLILTAGHCTQGLIAARIKIGVSNSLNGADEKFLHLVNWKTLQGDEYATVRTLDSAQFDIAYLKIEEDLFAKFNLSVDQVPKLLTSLAQLEAALLIGKNVGMTYGYGIFSHEQSGVKKQLSLKLDSHSIHNAIKGFSTERNVGVCEGDSGAGLFIPAQDGTTFLAGILSARATKPACGDVASYAAYASVAKNICWVQTESKINLHIEDCPNL